MNIRKPTDYTAMFAALDAAVAAQLPQMELYCEIGRVVSGRSEKGTAVAASEYLQAAYPAADGFSPRNVRRMRYFYRMYGNMPELLAEAMRLNWTQNVVIMEAGLTMNERRWYIRKAAESGLSKTELLRMIERAEHSEKRDYIMAKQKEQLAQQEKAVQEQTAQLENLKQENEKAHHQQVRRTTYQSLTLLSNDKKIQKQEKRLSELSQKIEDTENLLDEISAVAYDKAVAVVSENAVNDALKASTEQVDIYLDWLKEPGRKVSKETLDYTTYQVTTLRKNIIAAVNRITARLTTALIKPEIKKPAIEQIKENTRPSVLQKLQQRQEEINQREQTRTKPKKRSHGMEL